MDALSFVQGIRKDRENAEIVDKDLFGAIGADVANKKWQAMLGDIENDPSTMTITELKKYIVKVNKSIDEANDNLQNLPTEEAAYKERLKKAGAVGLAVGTLGAAVPFMKISARKKEEQAAADKAQAASNSAAGSASMAGYSNPLSSYKPTGRSSYATADKTLVPLP